MFSFRPIKLMEAATDIAKEHPDQRMVDYKYIYDDVKKLIKMLVSLDKKRLKVKALGLDEADVLNVAQYIPHNYYKVDMTNLFQIFNYRSSSTACEVLYREWQSEYDNKQCIDFLKELLEKNSDFQIMLRKYYLNEEQFKGIINSTNIPAVYAKICLEDDKKTRTENKVQSLEKNRFWEKINKYVISIDSRLYYNARTEFYKICRRKDYLEVDKGDLENIVRNYTDAGILDVRDFLVNFLGKLDLKDDLLGNRSKFDFLALFFHAKYGNINSEKCQLIFENVNETIRNKYRNWINILNIYRYFGDDERSLFWKQYQFEDVIKYYSCDAILLEFKNYFAIEFLGEAMGPMYFFDKPFFEEHIRVWMERYSKTDLKSKLFAHKEEAQLRKVHSGYWQYDINSYIIRNKITEKIVW